MIIMNINPYILLSPQLLEAMLKQPMYFVRQFYNRGFIEGDNRVPLLFSHYSHHEIDRERADRHMRLLWHDHLRFLYDSTKPAHVERLKQAAKQPKGYKIYTNVLPKAWETPRHIRNNVFHYVQKKFSVDSTVLNETLKIHLKDRFGDLYLALSWRGTKLEVTLDEIENVHSHVL